MDSQLLGQWNITGKTIGFGDDLFVAGKAFITVAGCRDGLRLYLHQIEGGGDLCSSARTLALTPNDSGDRAYGRDGSLWILLALRGKELSVVALQSSGPGFKDDDSGGEWNGGKP